MIDLLLINSDLYLELKIFLCRYKIFLDYERTFIKFAEKFYQMKTPIVVKALLIMPLIMIVDYVIMIVFGCAACRLGFSEAFYCGPYCLIGEAILLLSLGLFIILVSPDLKNLIKHRKDAKAD
jgi:hypothetical protein